MSSQIIVLNVKAQQLKNTALQEMTPYVMAGVMGTVVHGVKGLEVQFLISES